MAHHHVIVGHWEKQTSREREREKMSQTTGQKSKWLQLLEQSNISRFMKNPDFQSRILFPTKPSIKCNHSVKTFSNKKDLKNIAFFLNWSSEIHRKMQFTQMRKYVKRKVWCLGNQASRHKSRLILKEES